MAGGSNHPLILSCLDNHSNPMHTMGKCVTTMLLSSIPGGTRPPTVPFLNTPMNTDTTLTQEKSSRDIRKKISSHYLVKEGRESSKTNK